MERTFVIDPTLEERLKTLTKMAEEVVGLLVYSPKHADVHPVYGCRILGSGNQVTASIPDSARNAAEAFFRKNLHLKPIIFHTHTVGTIKHSGIYFATNFSQLDFETMHQGLRENPDTAYLLITPQTMLTYEQPPRSSRIVVLPVPRFEEREQEITKNFDAVTAELGYRPQKFNLTLLS